jgi:hypothetical protein
MDQWIHKLTRLWSLKFLSRWATGRFSVKIHLHGSNCVSHDGSFEQLMHNFKCRQWTRYSEPRPNLMLPGHGYRLQNCITNTSDSEHHDTKATRENPFKNWRKVPFVHHVTHLNMKPGSRHRVIQRTSWDCQYVCVHVAATTDVMNSSQTYAVYFCPLFLGQKLSVANTGKARTLPFNLYVGKRLWLHHEMRW